MKLILPFVVIIVALMSYKMKKSTRAGEEASKAFWERERQANATRKKNIDNLDYIIIPLESLPFFENLSKEISEVQDSIRTLSKERILNLGGMSNTDLKLEYGPANLDNLSVYDNNYSQLIILLTTWAGLLKDCGHTADAITVLEYALSIGSDSLTQYDMLIKLYSDCGQADKISSLRTSADKLNSITKNIILEHINNAL